MAAVAPAANNAEHASSTTSQQRAQQRSKRRADQLQPPAPTVTVLSHSLLHIPVSIPAIQSSPPQQQHTQPATTPLTSHVQQLSDELLLFPLPAAEQLASESSDPSLCVMGGPTRWAGTRASPGMYNLVPLLPSTFITQLHHTALTTPPSAPLTLSTFISAPPIAPPYLSSVSTTVPLSLDTLNLSVKRLKRERRVLMAGMARDVRVVSAYVRDSSSSSGAVDFKTREFGIGSSTMLESAVRHLGEVNDQLTLLSAVILHQTAEVT